MHEHVHWTGHSSRLDRDMTGSSFSQSYAFEELVAELGSVLLSLTLVYQWLEERAARQPKTIAESNGKSATVC
jgi:antirestriction protein ArdC